MLKVNNNFLYENNNPFFWQGDTAWLLFNKLTLEEAKLYLDNRKSLGFNVVQATIYHEIDEETNLFPNGRNINDIAYFEFVREIVKYAEDINIYMALLPSWGAYYKIGVINDNNYEQYFRFLVDFFKNQSNIIWVLGGDCRGDDCFDLFNKIGTLLKEIDPNRLLSYHPFGRTGSYLWFSKEKWIDLNMFQSGHRRYDQITLSSWDDNNANEDCFKEDNYKYVIKGLKYNRPILDAEPSYEGIVQGLHKFDEPYWEEHDVRRYAYWSVLAGACGFTYGNNAVMQFHRKNDKDANYGVREEWLEAIHAPGASQIKIIKDLFLELKMYNGVNSSHLIVNQGEKYHYIACNSSNDYIIAYTYLGDSITLDLSGFKNKQLKAFWINPQSGIKSFIGNIVNENKYTFKPVKRRELSNDWVLLIKVNSHE